MIDLLLFFIMEIFLVAIKGEPNSIKRMITIPKVWAMPIFPNSTAPIVLAIKGKKNKVKK